MANCIRCGRQLPAFSFKKICPWCVQHEAAQRGEDGDDARQPVMAVPWVRREQSSITLTHVIFGANIAVFIAMVLASGSIMQDFPPNVSIHFGANYGPYTLTGDWWRLVTYMFLHGDFFHIAMNMWCLWNLGTLCEALYGRWTYAAIYLITGVSGGIASVGWNPTVWSVGASGAIFGLAGALIASFYLGEFSLSGISIQGTLRSLVIFAVFNLFLGGFFGGIDNACHIGGLVSGLILGALIAVVAPQLDTPVRRVSVLIIVALAVAVSGVGVQRWRGTQIRMMRMSEAAEDNPAQAISELQAIAKQQPNSADVHFDLAQEYASLERYPEAEAEFKRVLELKPQYPDAQYRLGLVYLSDKRLADAKAVFTEILTQDANNAQGHYGMGLTLAEANQSAGAIEEFKKAIQLGQTRAYIYYEMGQNYYQLKMYDDAIASYLNEKKNGDDPDLETALADAYEAKGMTQEAQKARNLSAQLRGKHK
jgi:rhomboid protease GluP